MAKAVLVDAGVLVALIARRDRHHQWAVSQSTQWPAPWLTCESVLSEAFFLCGISGGKALAGFLRRGLLEVRFDLGTEIESVLALMEKYRDVPMSLADACLVRMTEIIADPVLLTADSDFRLYRRHTRKVIPCVLDLGIASSRASRITGARFTRSASTSEEPSRPARDGAPDRPGDAEY